MVLILNYYVSNKWCLKTHFTESYCILEEWVVGSAMRTYGMNDTNDPYEHEEDAVKTPNLPKNLKF